MKNIMVIPPYSQLMLPLLQWLADANIRRSSDAVGMLAEYVGLSASDRAELLPSGKQSRFGYRVQVASTYLRKAGLIHAPERGKLQITALGVRVLQNPPLSLTRAFLMQFPQFVDFVTRSTPERTTDAQPLELYDSEQTPRELIEILHRGLQKELADDVLEMVLASSPAFFEKLVLDLLVKMGYGVRGQHLGRSGDGGIDGIIQEDALGLDKLYIQAKRWARAQTVGRPVVQGFVGSLTGAGAGRGVLITTSRFSQEAIQYARTLQNHSVILIDGTRLTELMLEHNVGVSIEETFTLKTLNRDYFDAP